MLVRKNNGWLFSGRSVLLETSITKLFVNRFVFGYLWPHHPLLIFADILNIYLFHDIKKQTHQNVDNLLLPRCITDPRVYKRFEYKLISCQ